MTVKNIPTRYALVKRMEKLLKEIDDYFEDAADYGVSVQDADPDGMMQSIRKGLIESLTREGRIRIEMSAVRTPANHNPPVK